jgi:hypothetical protein
VLRKEFLPQAAVRPLVPFPPTNAEMHARVRAFREELRKRGWAAGVNVQFDERWTSDNMDLIRSAATNLVELRQVRLSPHPNSVDGSTSKVTPLWQLDDGLVFNLLPTWAPDVAVRKKILVDNPEQLYEFYSSCVESEVVPGVRAVADNLIVKPIEYGYQ